jgi:hypothetical protein
MTSFLHSCDSLGTRISLLHRGSPTYRSSLGGLFSLLSKAFIVFYFGFQLKAVFERDQKVVTQSVMKRDLGDPIEAPIVKLDRESFKVAIKLEVNIEEEWFVPEEVDRYIQVKYMQKNINIA